MKYFLLILTSLASAAISESPPLNTTCEMGINKQDAVWYEVQDLYKGNCDNVWGLADKAETLKNTKYPTNQGLSPSKIAKNQCYRNAIDEEVERIEENCILDNIPEECLAVGGLAAQVIVSEHGCSPQYNNDHGTSKLNYKKTCRSVAYGICKREIPTYTNDWCKKIQKPNTSTLLQLQNKCNMTVDSLTSGTSDDVSSNLRRAVTLLSDVIELSDKENEPTHKPTCIGGKLSCDWNPTCESATNHKQACMAAKDEYTVHYTCNGVRLYFAALSVVLSTLHFSTIFGTCLKNGATY